MGPVGWILSLVGSDIPADEPRDVSAQPDRLDAAEVVRRALSVVGQGRYRLGKGGRRPLAATPFDVAGLCDCSGFASWCLGLDRYQPGRIGGDWISTDLIVRDAQGPGLMFRVANDTRPGDLVVYPGRHVAGRRIAIGHVGVVTVPGATIATCRVAHCASSGPVAVRVSDGSPWARRGIVVRRAG